MIGVSCVEDNTSVSALRPWRLAAVQIVQLQVWRLIAVHSKWLGTEIGAAVESISFHQVLKSLQVQCLRVRDEVQCKNVILIKTFV